MLLFIVATFGAYTFIYRPTSTGKCMLLVFLFYLLVYLRDKVFHMFLIKGILYEPNETLVTRMLCLFSLEI